MADFTRFIQEAQGVLPERQVHTDELLVKAYSVDGSPFEPIAKAVVDIYNPEQLGLLLAIARKTGVSLTYRGSGTGVSGQTIARDVTVRLLGPYWKRIDVLDGGERVRARCGVIGAEVNAALKPHGRYMTADPSSISAASIGGMAATKAAGLGCTVDKNLYSMMTGLHFTLADGADVDTEDPGSVARFRESHAGMLMRLAALRARILADDAMRETILRKFSIRNTTGYSLNAFTDFEDPVDILAHLLIGSEGTLGFIHSITIRTERLRPHRSTALVGFSSLDDAIQAVLLLEKRCSMYAVEFLNHVSLNALMQLPAFPDFLRGLGSDACALLLETNAETPQDLAANVAGVNAVFEEVKPVSPVNFETDHAVCEALWNVRRALFPLLAGTRHPEEFAYSEDYCVPINNLPQACRSFVEILHKYGFTKSGVHGHALHGNIHFSIPLRINDPAAIADVAKVIEEVAVVVLGLGGALKAEHGTGRAVAPFVRQEWGDELTQVMYELKEIIDPLNIMNPDVLLNEDPNGHLAGLKYAVAVDPIVDTCIDCGFCEYVCPSGGVGLSSRQRIYTLRTIAGLRRDGRNDLADKWEAAFKRLGVDLCAADGLCATRCPLGIDIAGLMKKLRGRGHSALAKGVASSVAGHFGLLEGAASGLLRVGSGAHRLLGHSLASASGSLAGAAVGMKIPDLHEVRLTGGSPVPRSCVTPDAPAVVYYPSCAVRMMGYKGAGGAGEDPLMDVAVRLLRKAGYSVILPDKAKGLCCGKMFETKGLHEQADAKLKELETALLALSGNGEIPVLCETSPCVARMKKKMDPRISIQEPVAFVLEHLAGRLEFVRKQRKVALHPTCSIREMGLVDKFREVAERCVTSVVIPENIFCCGFSGDKGFTHPQLNAFALRHLEEQIRDCEEGYSSSRTCEVGLTLHGKKPYRNILYLIDECTR
jgi:D-lactate dehydrogenase